MVTIRDIIIDDANFVVFVSVVNGACDRNAVTKCMEGNAKDSDTQCK